MNDDTSDYDTGETAPEKTETPPPAGMSDLEKTMAIYETIAAAEKNGSPAEAPAPAAPLPAKKKRGCFFYFLLILGAGILLAAGTIGGLRYRYNDAYLQKTAEETLSEALGLECRIGSFKSSVFTGSAQLTDITLNLGTGAVAPGAAPRLFTIEKINANVALWASLLSAGLHADVTVDGWELAIRRERRAMRGRNNAAKGGGARSGKNKPGKAAETADDDDPANHTTNIHETLRQLAALPWQEWAKKLDVLMLADTVDFKILNGKVSLHDGAGRLGDCVLAVKDFSLGKKAHNAAAALSLELTTPTAPQPGTFSFAAAFTFHPEAAGLDKVRGLQVSGDFTNLDVPYITRYYGVGWRLHRRSRLLLGAPLSGKLLAQTASLAEDFTVSCEAATPQLFAIAPADPALIFPALSLSGSLKGRLPNTWSLDKTVLTVGLPGMKWLELALSGNGRLGEELTLNLSLHQNLGAFAESAIAERCGMGRNFTGNVDLKAFAKIAPKDRSTVSVDMIANNFGVKVDGQMQQFPLSGRTSCQFASGASNELKDIEVDMKITSPIFSCSTGNDFLRMPSSADPWNFQGNFTVELDTGELYKRFRNTMTELGLGNLQEQISGTVSCDGKALQCALSLKNLSSQPDPLLLTASVSPLSGDARDFKAEIKSADKYLFLQAGGKMTTAKDGTLNIDFTQQSAMYLQKGAAFYRRFASLFGDGKLPAMQGVFRGRLDGKFTQKGDAVTAAVQANTLLENAALRDGDFSWREPKAQITGDFAYTENAAARTLTVKSLQMRSSSANLNFTAGALPLHLLNDGLSPFIRKLPAVNLGLVVGENAWRQVNYLTGNAIPEALFGLDSQATVLANFDPQTQALAIKKAEVKSGEKSAAALKELALNLTVSNLDKLAENHSLPQILASLPQGLHIAKAVLSVDAIKKIPGAQENASVRALQGRHILVNDLHLTPKDGGFVLSGMAGLALAFNNDPGKPPLLQMGGYAGFTPQNPAILKLGKNAVEATGVLDLTNCAIRFNALAPYIYQKANKQPLHLSFAANQHANGNVEVASAKLSGGMLPVEIQRFALAAPSPDEINVKLASAKIGAPFNLSVNDVELNKKRNLIRGDIAAGPIDLAMLAGFMPSLKGAQLSGKLERAAVHLDLPYQALLGKTVTLNNLGRTTVETGTFALKVQNPQNRAALRCAFSGAKLDGQSGKLTIRGFQLANPTGFSQKEPAASFAALTITPRLATLGTATFVIDEILLEQLRVLYESQKNGNNFTALQDAVEGLTGTSAADAGTAAPAPRTKTAANTAAPQVTTSEAAPPVLIKLLRTANSAVKIASIGGAENGREVPLNLSLTNIGEAGGGNLFWQIIKSMTWPITKEILKSLVKLDPKLVLNLGGQLLDSAGLSNVKDIIGKTGVPLDATKNAVGGILDIGKKLIDGNDERKPADKRSDEKKIEEAGSKLLNGIFGGKDKKHKDR